MTDRVFWVGINDYPAGLALNGCINDSQAMTRMLIDHFDFPAGDVRVLNAPQETTKRLWKQGVEEACTGLAKGDRLVLGYSGHGSYVGDVSGDEPLYDEVMVASDLELFIDDEWRELLSNLPKGVKCTVWADSCFSGTVTRALFSEAMPGFVDLVKLMPHLKRLLEWRIRFANPLLLDMPQRAAEILENPLEAKPKRMMYPQSSMTALLMSGCRDNEYSYDVKFPSGYFGAMTYAGLETIKAHNYHLSYATLEKAINQNLTKGGYPQHPQLEGPSGWKRRLVFR